MHVCCRGEDQERISINSVVLISLYPEVLREVVRKAKTDRLLLETDCPYLPPQAFRGQRNEPAHLLYTAQEVARLLNMLLPELGRLTTENARRLFRLPPVE